MLLMDVNYLLNFIVAAKEDTAAVVDMLWHHREQPPHLAIDCLATGCTSN